MLKTKPLKSKLVTKLEVDKDNHNVLKMSDLEMSGQQWNLLFVVWEFSRSLPLPFPPFSGPKSLVLGADPWWNCSLPHRRSIDPTVTQVFIRGEPTCTFLIMGHWEIS